ncbi:MAG: 6-phosphofructo-2-kinase/fructose-2,6-bisphosphatase [Desulfovibrionaceae bacterium]|nr:6-phosphofructo-2-kinase/fructose-2,6-bisphosphatase [Desulfovibrionaceae bacterium]
MKLYVAMVGLPARGKSSLARRIQSGLNELGIHTGIFNSGEIRRKLYGKESTVPEFFNPKNLTFLQIRARISRINIDQAKAWIREPGNQVAVIDATNGTPAQREMLTRELNDYPLLFIECVNEDPLLLEASIQQKTLLPEFHSLRKSEALRSFQIRMAYYESVYTPLSTERCWIRVDAVANRILTEHPVGDMPFYTAIRDILSTLWVKDLYLIRHGETDYNREGRIGGNPPLNVTGRKQSLKLAAHLAAKDIPYIFTSTKRRSIMMSQAFLNRHPNAACRELQEFDELNAGDCEGMTYREIAETMPDEYRARSRNKYLYRYPGQDGESYRDLSVRVTRGLRRALFIAKGEPLVIVGHQAVNRVLLSLFLCRPPLDIPYLFIPQNQYYHISVTQRKKLFELIPFAKK